MSRYKFPVIFYLTTADNSSTARNMMEASLAAGKILTQLYDYENAKIERTDTGVYYLSVDVQQAPSTATFKEVVGYSENDNTTETREVETTRGAEVSKNRPSKK